MLDLKKFLIVGVALASMCGVNATSLYGIYGDCNCVEPITDLSISAGWRRDEIKGSFKRDRHHSSSDSSSSSSSSSSGRHDKRDFDLKDLNTWELGLQLHAQLPDWCTCGCDGYNDCNWWLRQFFIKGYAYWGWVTDGKFHDRDRHDHSNGGNNLVGQSNGSHDRRFHGSVRDGETVDGQIAVGFLYPLCDGFGIGPVGGWSYDQIKIKSKAKHRRDHSGSNNNGGNNASPIVNNDSSTVVVVDEINKQSNGGSSSHDRESARYTTTWEGPFIGFEAVYNWCYCDTQIQFDLGYEYHFARHRASFRQHERHHSSSSSSSDCDDDRDHHSNDGWGNVVYVDARYNLCDCWDAVLGFDYKFFKTDKSHRGNNEWESFGVTLDLAYRF